MPKFRRKPTVVEEKHATQYFHGMENVEGVQFNSDNQPYVVTMQGQKVPISDGEWVVRESDGIHYYPIDDEEFRRLYEQVQDD